MRIITRVTFDAHNATHTQVVAQYNDGSSEVVYLDNISAKGFLRAALIKGQLQGGVNLWV
jgi:hypothetical protein